MRIKVFILCFIVSATAFAQNGYYFAGLDTLPDLALTAKTIDLKYPVEMYNVKAIGMGNTQMALGKTFNAMMYNPAFLGNPQKRFDILGIGTSLPPNTYDAAWYLSDNMDEFLDATSLTQVYESAEAFFAANTMEDRLNALHEIKDGMQFTLDLVEKVTGPAENPYRHGVSAIPSITAQYGNWGFSLFGFGYSGFAVQLSPTLESLIDIDIPENLDNPLESAKSITKVLGTLSTVFLGKSQGFVNEVYPIAFYMAYLDIVGSVGYGFQWRDHWMFGANLKVVNRRFSTNRIAVIDYDEILNEALNKLESDETGITADLGCLYKFDFGTSIGLSLQNLVPIQTIKESITTDFRSSPRFIFERNPNGSIHTNAEGDTAIVAAFRKISVERPFELTSPFIISAGVSHSVTNNWDVALDWVDIAEEDSRYTKTTQRIRLGTEYRFNLWKNKYILSIRSGMADEKGALGLGFNIMNYLQLDAAYAYDRFVDTYSYFGQIKFGW